MIGGNSRDVNMTSVNWSKWYQFHPGS
jgi:hypothetical protein